MVGRRRSSDDRPSDDPFWFPEKLHSGVDPERGRLVDGGEAPSPFDFGPSPRAAPAMPPRPANRSYRQRWPWLAGGLSGIALIAVVAVVVVNTLGGDPGAVGGSSPSVPPSGSDGEAGADSVMYEVRGRGPAASVDFSAPDTNGESQLMNVPLPFRVSVPSAGVSSVYTIVAQSGPDGGSISCSIVSDGNRLDERSADGPSASVACSGGG